MATSVDTLSNPNNNGSIWRHLFGLIDRPTATFEAVLARQHWSRWVVPLLVLLLAFAATSVVNLPYTQELAREQAERQLSAMPAEQADQARANMETAFSLPVMLATTLGFGSLALLVGLLAQATFLYFTALMFGGDDMTFGSMFTMATWSRLPLALGYLVQAGFIAVSQGAIRYPGLAALVASGEPLQDAQNPLVVLLGRIDLFWLWHLLLVTLGLAVIARFSRGKSFLITLFYAALVLGLTVLPTLLFGGTLGG